ncbi:MAG: hypothetical protein GYA21_07540 [Myxococcales bacterium]|nr:hypothetical protein [Myxococcales bacterium]
MRSGSSLLALSFGLLASACGSSGGGPDGYPDPAFVYRATGQVATAADESFRYEKPRLYRTTAELGDLDVRALAAVDGGVYAGTASGLFRYDSGNDRFERISLPGGDGAVVDIASTPMSDGRIVVGLADRVILLASGSGSESIALSEVRAVASDGSRVFAGTTTGLFRLEGGAFVAAPEAAGQSVRDVAVDAAGDVWLATGTGLARLSAGSLSMITASSGKLPDDDVRALAAPPEGGMLAGCATGLARVGGGADRVMTAGIGQLPTADVRAVAAAPGLWAVGHDIGASVLDPDRTHLDYYQSLRWIPAQTVTAVALEENRRWIATTAGVSRIDLVPTTLAERAARFEAENDYHWRLDFVSCDDALADPWEPHGARAHWDHDNDGLWTQMQIAAWSYAAAASGNRSFCEPARRAMRAMMDEIDLPAVSFEAAGKTRGFVARSFVRDDEGEVYTSKAGSDRWVRVENFRGEGHDYYWKNDTSSDEITGHFFGYPLYFDLCASDQAEREEVAEHAAALARYIVQGGFVLLDLDGARTTFGYWDPDTLTSALDGLEKCQETHPVDVCIASRYGAGWLNGMQILGVLLSTWHMTGDTFFYDAYEELITRYRYAELVDFSDNVWNVTQRFTANHSDHELALLAYHTLIRYEPNDERRERWIRSLRSMLEWEAPERNPLWHAILAGFVTEGYDLAGALQTLREWPEDWRAWMIDNSHRKDYTKDSSPDRFGDPQFTTVPPYDEISFLKWNGNPYRVRDGGDGREIQAPWPWLLPYWIMRYHEVIH